MFCAQVVAIAQQYAGRWWEDLLAALQCRQVGSVPCAKVKSCCPSPSQLVARAQVHRDLYMDCAISSIPTLPKRQLV